MDHAITVRGLAFGLRPVAIDDAEFVVRLRSDDQLSRFLPRIPYDVDAQERWLQEYLLRAGDYYFVVIEEATERPVGLVGIYDVDPARREAEWGRWVLETGSLGGAESARHIYHVGFGVLGLDRLYCRTAAMNEQVLRFHDGCGLRRVELLSDHLRTPDGPLDAWEHELLTADAPSTLAFLDDRCEAVARLVRRSHAR